MFKLVYLRSNTQLLTIAQLHSTRKIPCAVCMYSIDTDGLTPVTPLKTVPTITQKPVLVLNTSWS